VGSTSKSRDQEIVIRFTGFKIACENGSPHLFDGDEALAEPNHMATTCWLP
jgi:hypothetical protein